MDRNQGRKSVDPPSVAECKKLLTQEPDSRRYQDLLKIAESDEPQFKPFPMRALAIGDELCILALTGEMFAEYQLWLDQASPFKHTFFFIHTNGCTGYVATKKDYELGPAGGYEAWLFPSRRPPFVPLQPSVEQLIREGIMDLLNELKSDVQVTGVDETQPNLAWNRQEEETAESAGETYVNAELAAKRINAAAD